MPCLCSACHEVCGCDEILCSRCLVDAIKKENQECACDNCKCQDGVQ
jgi:hypothetical protein